MNASEAAESADLIEKLAKIPLFRDIKGKLLKELAQDLRIEPFEAGAVLLHQGEYTSSFYVVMKGLATAYRAETDGTTEIVGTHAAGDWFGEMPALSHQPQFATVKASAPSVLLVLSDHRFRQAYQRVKGFAAMIDERYRERALAVHLRSAPLFHRAPRQVLDHLSEQAELVTFPENSTIATEGEEAEAVYLVRSGVVKRVGVSADTGQETIQAYLCENSSFGECSLSSQPSWPATYKTMTRVDTVRLTREQFRRVYREVQGAESLLTRTAEALNFEESGVNTSSSPPSDAELDLMVNKKAVVGGRALVIDLKRCTRCNACVESCVAVHDDGIARLNKRGIRTEAGEHMLTSACYHCKIPECMLSCKYGAIRRDLNGGIDFIFDNCTGCSKCEESCPYGVISIAEMVDPAKAKEPAPGSFFRELPVLNRFFGKSEPEDLEARMKKAIKCDLCAGMPFEACVYNCPCSAISRIDPEQFAAEGLFDHD